METINKNLSDQIKFFRNQLGWTQEELAEKVGVTFQAVSKWENGKTAPDIMLLPTLAKIFSCTIDELFSMPTQAKEQDVLPWQDEWWAAREEEKKVRYQCTCPEHEERPCDNHNENLECQDCQHGKPEEETE